MDIADITDDIVRRFEGAQESVAGYLFEPVIRLGVTGLSRAGKTVFITSLVANLLNRDRMAQLRAVTEGRIQAAYLQPQPDDDVPRFAYETHLQALHGQEPSWPASTRQISQLRLSLRMAQRGVLSRMRGLKTVHIDIVDYPGEWLLDLPLLQQSYADWSARALALARSDGRAELARNWLATVADTDPRSQLDELVAASQAKAFTAYLAAARNASLSACAPGRFLMPGDLDGSPALTFAPLEVSGNCRSGTLHAAFEHRFEAYKRVVVKPFFRNHFARLDRQIVLVDALGAINAGPGAVADMRTALADILTCFNPGKNTWLSRITGRKIDRILFAATKADHLHHTQHDKLSAIMAAMVAEARDRANFRGATTRAMALAALRATVEQTIDHKGDSLNCVRGRMSETGKEAALYAGDLPDDPGDVLNPGASKSWLAEDYNIMKFEPPILTRQQQAGLPHIRLDRAAEFLLGDKL